LTSPVPKPGERETSAIPDKIGWYVLLALGCGCASAPSPVRPAPAAPVRAAPMAEPIRAPEPTPLVGARAIPSTATLAAPPSFQPASIAKVPFGRVDEQRVDLYTLINAHGLTMKVTTYGAILTNLLVPDRAGKLGDVVLGFDDLEGYVNGHAYFGATVGRVGNRIRNARFTLRGKTYRLAANDKPNHLHGGVKGWDRAIWEARPLESPEGPGLELTYVSRDGEEGYPGRVSASVVYLLTNGNELRVTMRATADRTTVVNMVHHTYWNLGGAGAGPITDHQLVLHADRYTPGDPLVPTGVVKAVKGTAFDFTTGKSVGRDLGSVGGHPAGFDHNFVVDGDPASLRPVARLEDPGSGRVMTLNADQPGVQFYTGNFLDGSTRGKGGQAYGQYAGLCLETQKFPNAINIPAWRHQVILRPDQPIRTR
jgi:aldose 1-epimerase